MSFTKTDFKGIVYASEITPSEFILDYINGKGQFYIENSSYPLLKNSLKRPFVTQDFKSKFGIQIHSPMICFNDRGNYTTRFTILWTKNEAAVDKTVRVLYPYGGVDETTKSPIVTPKVEGKFKKLSIPLTSMSEITTATDDQNLALLSFHLTEAFMITIISYLFDINLANASYKALKTNDEFYAQFISDMNGYLKSKKSKKLIENINDESISHMNSVLYYRDDTTVKQKVKPKVPYYKELDGEEVRYIRMETLIDKLKELALELNDEGVEISKYFSGPKAEMIQNITYCQALKNSNTMRTYVHKENEDDDGVILENFQIKGLFNIKQYKSESVDKMAGLSTQVFDELSHKWRPIDDEHLLMDLYKSRVAGLIYLEIYFTFGMFKDVSIGLNTRVVKLDVTKVANTGVSDDAATALSELRRRYNGTPSSGSDIEDDEISRDHE